MKMPKMLGWSSWVLGLLFIYRIVFAQVSASINDVNTCQNDTITVPIIVEDVTGKQIESFQFNLFFSDSVLVPVDVTLSGSISESWGTPFVNDHNSGELRIGAYGINKLEGGGALLFVKFAVAGHLGDSTSLHIENFLFNNGIPQVTIHDGKVFVNSVQLFVTSNVNGLRLNVDGDNFETPVKLNFLPNSIHSVSLDSVQAFSSGIRYVFLNWSDQNPISHTVSLDSTNLNLRINMKTQYYLTIDYQPDYAGYSVPDAPGLWTDKSDSITLTAYAHDHFHFMGWTGDIDLNVNPVTIKVEKPMRVTANFGSIFPVELSCWEAQWKTENSVRLHWQTKSETDNFGFYIERRIKSSKFKSIGFVKGHGTSGEVNNYYFEDKKLVQGKYFYQLKEVEVNGNIRYSNELMVYIGVSRNYELLQNYPNPFKSTTSITFNLLKTNRVNLQIYNMLGQEVYSFPTEDLMKGMHNYTWDGRTNSGEKVPGGIYILKLHTGNYLATRRIVLIKYLTK